MGEGRRPRDLCLRAGGQGDARAIAELNVAAWRAGYAGLMAPELLFRLSVDEREARWRELLGRRDAATFVAEVGGELAGYCTVAPGAPAELKTLYVDPARWRAGIGSALLGRGLDALADAACSDVVVWVFARNVRARAFYARWGFEPDGATTYDAPTHLHMVRLARGLPGVRRPSLSPSG